VFAEVYKETGSVDVVFANAGVSEVGSFLEKGAGEPTKPNLKTLDVNITGTLYCEFSR
jgi:NADP-dependent 3-hydroxy acid dehydrogenase YdfG